MEFKPKHKAGGWVEQVPGLTGEALRLLLPQKLRDRPESSAFLSAVVESASNFYFMYRDGWKLSAAQTRDSIESLERVAHELQNALSRFSGGGSDEFDVLNAHFDYLVIRNDERGMPTAGRPVVPPLPTATPELAELLTRINTDLSALRTGCTYAANLIQPERNLTKDQELAFATAIANCFKTHFGERPPKRGTFAPFVEEVGRYLSLNIGAAVTAAEVETLE